jgi:predicted  nucleic acid-binding Zn-ribbon protein
MTMTAKLDGRLQIMLPILEKLLVLQDRDVRVSQLKFEALRIPAELAAVEARLQQEAQRLSTLRDQIKHIEAARKKLEIDADSKRAQILKYRGQLTQIKSNTEYQVLLKEIANLESEITGIEDSELELMEQAEQVQPELQKEQALLKELTAQVETDKASLQKRTALIDEELSKLQADRQSLTVAVDADALSRYERLMRSKGDAAVVAVHNGNCGGCHLHIPAQQVYNARYGEQLTSCDYCGRILYYPGD